MPAEDSDFTDVPRYATLQDYLRVLRERWKLIAAFTIVLGGAAFAYSATQPKTYEALTTISAQQRSADIGLIGTSAGPPVSPQALTAELAAIVERDSVARGVERSLDVGLTADQIAARVSGAIDAQTNLVQITASSQDPVLATQLANEAAKQVEREALLSEREQIDDALGLIRRQLKEAKQEEVVPNASNEVLILQERFNRLQALRRISSPVEIVTAAAVPKVPVSPKPIRNTMLGLLAGLFLGIVAAFMRDSLDSRLKTPTEIEEHFGLSRVGQLTDSAFGRTVSGTNGKRQFDPIDLEAARIMRTNLDSLDPDDKLRSLVVTSPLPGEGKSTVALALAWASAIAGKRTLLVEGDLRKPVFAERLNLPPTPGLSDALLGKATPKDVLRALDFGAPGEGNGATVSLEQSRLVCITAGTPVAGPAEILASDRFVGFLEQVTSVYDVVVIDTSPLLSVVDTRELLPLVDGVVICARSYQTTRDQAQATRKALEHSSTQLAGLVVTGVALRDDDYSAYYQSYIGANKRDVAD